MNIAYIILAHKYPRQIARMVRRLNSRNATFLVHIDKKASPEIYRQTVEELSDLKNVQFLRRYTCYWAEYGDVDAMLAGMRAVRELPMSFQRVVLLSGQHYPIKPLEQIEQTLRDHPDKEFLEYMDYRHAPDGAWPTSGVDRVHFWHLRIWKFNLVIPGELKQNSVNRYRRMHKRGFGLASAAWSLVMKCAPLKRRTPKDLAMTRGSQWWCLTRDCVEYVCRYLDENPRVTRFFRYADVPDEMLLQSVVASSPFRDRVTQNNLVLIDWARPNPTSPRVMDSSDFEELEKSTHLFARKFDMQRDPAILDRIDRSLIDWSGEAGQTDGHENCAAATHDRFSLSHASLPRAAIDSQNDDA